MRLRHLAACLAIGLVMSLAGACGGGYGGGGGMGSGGGYGASPPPSVAFTAPAQAMSINLGQAVKLAWTASNATSCTASASSATAGSFSGSQPATGQTSVVPTAMGNVTYTLSCSGAGGMQSATTQTLTVNPSILSQLASVAPSAIGSTIDPIEQGGNPYGLALAPASAGLVSAGDLLVCNFNDGATNSQGKGTTLVGLHPSAGAQPYRIAQSGSLEGCNALAALADGTIAAAAITSNQVPLVSTSGALTTPFAADGFAAPWGITYVAASGGKSAALYVADLGGSIDRIELNGDAQSSFTTIASGFCGSGSPGAIFAPAGLTYDPSIDTLYIVDTSSNSVVAFTNVTAIAANGIVVDGQCNTVAAPPTPAPTFSGPAAASARVIAHGGPFIAPISAALLADGDLIVTNGDVNIGSGQMANLAVEVSPVLPGGFVGEPIQLDTSGTPGALFGVVATVDAQGHQIVYFNDDNTNTVMKLAAP
ncbi:MAG TPA: hypothetical protein VMT66_16015 [Steroidobacteraceae bacterium]|nr:hypothetical protein [Steroidobacteraceae bacterium]